MKIGSSSQNPTHVILFFLPSSHLTIEISSIVNIISLGNMYCCLPNEKCLNIKYNIIDNYLNYLSLKNYIMPRHIDIFLLKEWHNFGIYVNHFSL